MAMDIELAHDVESTPHHRRLAILVGIAAILAAVLGVLQMHAGQQESRAGALGTRLSSEISRGVGIEGLVGSFQLPTAQAILSESIAAHARAIEALEARLGAEVAVPAAEAESAAVERLVAIIDEMAETPGPESGVDPNTLETLDRSLEDLAALTEEQNEVVDRAQRFSRRGDRLVLALSLAAVAAVLLGLAGIVGPGRAGTVVLWAAGIGLLAGAATGGSALLI